MIENIACVHVVLMYTVLLTLKNWVSSMTIKREIGYTQVAPPLCLVGLLCFESCCNYLAVVHLRVCYHTNVHGTLATHFMTHYIDIVMLHASGCIHMCVCVCVCVCACVFVCVCVCVCVVGYMVEEVGNA
jgi:hypothetical protein